MDKSIEDRAERLEILYSEQEYTIQALDDRVAQQEQDIASLRLTIEQISNQLQGLKNELSTDAAPADEKPPHY